MGRKCYLPLSNRTTTYKYSREPMNMATLGPVTDTNDGAAQFEMANTAYRIPRLKKKSCKFFFSNEQDNVA